jgi:hypothetical protein
MADERPGFFKRAGAALGDLLGGGAAEQGGYYEGLKFRSGIESEQASRELAMARARAQREENRRRQYVEDLGNMPGFDLERAPLGSIMAGGMGSDYAGAGSGLLRGQERRFRERAADPNVPIDEANRRLMGAASGPVQTLRSVGSRGYTDIMNPEAGVMALGEEFFPASVEPSEYVRDPETGETIVVPRSEAFGMERGYADRQGRMTPEEAAIRRLLEQYGEEFMFDPETGELADPLDAVRRLQDVARQLNAPNVTDTRGGVIRLGPSDQALFEQLPSGTPFIDPHGFRRIKP